MDIHPEEHFDPTIEISLETVKERVVKGVVTLTSQYFVLYGIYFLAQAALTILLSPAQFGIFGVLSAVKNFMSYFSDIGLSASLIQKKEKITNEDLKTSFTVQQTLVVLLLIALFFATPLIKNIYHLGQDGIFLLYALGLSLLFSSLKTIPSVLLERELKFQRIAFVNILEAIIFNLILVFLAWHGLGLTSYTIAFLVSGAIGLSLMYFMQPWMPGLMVSVPVLKRLLKFGIPYQMNTFIALLKDDGLILLLGKILGVGGVGILVWAQGWSQAPLRVVMDTVTKVTFPAFARLQDKVEDLARTLTRSIFFITFLVFPAVIGLVVLVPMLVHVVPRWEKWEPGILPLAFLAINTLFASFTTQLTNLFNAIGKIKITSYLMIMWTVLTLALVPALGVKYGVNGAAFAYGLVGVSSLIVVYIAKKLVNFSINESIMKALYASTAMGTLLYILQKILTPSIYSVGIMVVSGSVFYGILMFMFVGESLIDDVKKVGVTIFKRT